jgi:hypothetical protein
MLSQYPRFRKGASQGLVPKLGGLPWGLPARLWPVCEECRRPMSHLGQFPARSADAQAPLLPLADDQVLFLFKCEWDSVCSFWESDGGANKVLCVPYEQLGDWLAPPPADLDGDELVILPELGVATWLAHDDGVPADREEDFYDHGRHAALPDEFAQPHGWEGEWRTKFGGVPYWTANGAQGQPGVPKGRLLLQIDNWVQMEDGSFQEVANFCSDGTAFVFIDSAQAPPELSMIINR